MTSWINSKGQTQQVFLFLVAVIVIIATIFLGGKLFGFVTSTSCGASDTTFVREIKHMLNDNALYGSRNVVTIDGPCEARELCFVDAVAIGNPFPQPVDPTIDASVSNGVRTNIFLQKESGMLAVGYDERIGLQNPQTVLCIPLERGFTFTTEGYGRTIIIGAP
ncbi:MAG: hypothetical protein OXR66_06085 [Candidatus Woesearchaeota archaeon]|nr:hypothetical protein [Candidatus Woesearchaeota archaeon]